MTKLEQAARQALEAMKDAAFDADDYVLDSFLAKAYTTLREAIEAAPEPSAVEQEPVQTRERFESWVKAYSTLPLAKDSHGYADMTVEMLWHAWQAAKTNAPEGASWGESDANTRLGLAGYDSNCKHEFSVQPSSGIRLCAHCGLSEVAARKHTTPKVVAVEQEPVTWIANDWSVFNTGAEVASGLSLNEAMDYLTDERAARGWSVVCVINKDNMPTPAADR